MHSWKSTLTSLGFRRKKQEKQSNRRERRSTLESLESRALFSVNATFSSGLLTVTGDTANDTIRVTYANVGGSNYVRVNGADVGSGVLASSVTSISVDGGAGGDTIDLSGVGAPVFPAATQVTINGGDGNDDITGSGFVDTIHGGNGDDLVNGWSGNDIVYGDAGNDQLYGRDGDDWIYGGDGDDLLAGRVGNDHLYGEAGNDRLVGDQGDDYLDGGTGTNSLIGNAGSDTIVNDDGASSPHFDQLPVLVTPDNGITTLNHSTVLHPQYDSNADGHVTLTFPAYIPDGTFDRIEAEVTVGGVSMGTAEFNEFHGTGQFGLEVDASSLSTGHYNYSVTFTFWNGSDPAGIGPVTQYGAVNVINRVNNPTAGTWNSEFGTGWSLPSVDRLIIQPFQAE